MQVSWFGNKIKVDGFSQFGIKTSGYGFLVWASKPTAVVWGFGHQNHRNGFLGCALKSSGLRFVGCATKSMGG
jgi:hypothetical protein